MLSLSSWLLNKQKLYPQRWLKKTSETLKPLYFIILAGIVTRHIAVDSSRFDKKNLPTCHHPVSQGANVIIKAPLRSEEEDRKRHVQERLWTRWYAVDRGLQVTLQGTNPHPTKREKEKHRLKSAKREKDMLVPWRVPETNRESLPLRINGLKMQFPSGVRPIC